MMFGKPGDGEAGLFRELHLIRHLTDQCRNAAPGIALRGKVEEPEIHAVVPPRPSLGATGAPGAGMLSATVEATGGKSKACRRFSGVWRRSDRLPAWVAGPGASRPSTSAAS